MIKNYDKLICYGDSDKDKGTDGCDIDHEVVCVPAGKNEK